MRLTAKITITAVASLFMATTVYAHSFWVNTFESFAHQPGHVTVGLGWGHTLPIDDILNSPNGKILVESFTGSTLTLNVN